jgi:reverse gyrase
MMSFRREALHLLNEIGREPFEFQGIAVERSIASVDDGSRVLIQAPTGAGKTVIAFLTAALLSRRAGAGWSALMVVPSRPLLRQHVADASWLREVCDLPVHFLGPEDPWPMWEAVLSGPGLVCTTPQSLRSRLDGLGSPEMLTRFDVAFFDEIDIFVTVELQERRDLWPVLQSCMEARLPVLGFTGTALDSAAIRAWEKHGFARFEPEIPEGWLPYTTIQFVGIHNSTVITEDERIDNGLRAAYKAYEAGGGNPRSWQMIKLDAQGGPRAQPARRILSLHSERLMLFEGTTDTAGKLLGVRDALNGKTGLVLCRYVSAAKAMHDYLSQSRERIVQADGTMTRAEMESRAQALRSGEADVLVMTRELGGRGLDFPDVQTAAVLSPRSQYQAVAQELARIRSRRQQPKGTFVFYYTQTAETAKAKRLAQHLARDNVYRATKLFDIEAAPDARVIPKRELAHLVNEESITM